MSEIYPLGLLAKLRLEGKTLRNFVLEFALIVLGVLLALAMNEWRADREKQAQSKISLQHIARELQTNRKIVEIVQKKNAIFMRPDAKLEDDSSYTPALQITDSAWQHLLRIGLSEQLDEQTLLLLSDLYAIQEVYRNVGYQFIQAYLTSSFQITLEDDDKRQDRVANKLRSILGLMAQLEQTLLQKYDTALEKLAGENRLAAVMKQE